MVSDVNLHPYNEASGNEMEEGSGAESTASEDSFASAQSDAESDGEMDLDVLAQRSVDVLNGHMEEEIAQAAEKATKKRAREARAAARVAAAGSAAVGVQGGGSVSGAGRGKRKTPEQLVVLLAAFDADSSLPASRKRKLASETGLTMTQVIHWFDGEKRRRRKQASAAPTPASVATPASAAPTPASAAPTRPKQHQPASAAPTSAAGAVAGAAAGIATRQEAEEEAQRLITRVVENKFTTEEHAQRLMEMLVEAVRTAPDGDCAIHTSAYYLGKPCVTARTNEPWRCSTDDVLHIRKEIADTMDANPHWRPLEWSERRWKAMIKAQRKERVFVNEYAMHAMVRRCTLTST